MSTPTRTYRGRDVDELIPRIQRELGAEAIIVRRREGLSGGFLGFFQHPFVEIEAMPGGPRIDVYDEAEPVVPAPSAAVAPERASAPPPGARAYEQPPPAAAPPPAFAPPPAPLAAPAPPAPAPPSPVHAREAAGSPAFGSAYVTAHLAALARAGPPPPPEPHRGPPASLDFEELIPRDLPAPLPPLPPRRAPVEYVPTPRAAEPPRAPERRSVAPGSHARARAGVEKSLFRLGVSEALAHELIATASAHTLPLAPRLGLAQAVRATLAQRIPVVPLLPSKGAAVVVVGAGGAGKTTCCATLLGAYRAGSTLPASCATLLRADGGGELQLLLSPQIMKPTLAGSQRALRALRRARTEGMAVIDTPRVSPADRAGIRDLARLLAELEPERVVVALPATLGAAAAAQLLEALAPLGADALAVTHADETDQLGVAVEAACRFGLAPEYMLDRPRSGGWRIARIDPTGLAARLLP
jgi:flagellar biosynthesis protein FlhF